ncbi:MAG: DNA polymerase I [Burkholderiaceae bacterium]|jgi:DNA polymerase-1|nr:DNA polymerase I [Burkholderiaceae bacterium]
MKNTLLLVDGSGFLYRAYHALPDLRGPSGEPTGAIHGFLSMLRRLEKAYPSAYLTCVFDAKGKTFRHTLYPDYKANRPAMPVDLVSQIAVVQDIIRLHGLPIISVEGVEADDVIGTLARRGKEAGYEVLIVTSDKDMAQLVCEGISLLDTRQDEKLDRQGIVGKFGVPPEAMVDYLALVGDTSDNVPGVHKVGPKTALKWLSQYGSLDKLLSCADDIGGVVGENLRQAREWLPTARQLLTIDTHCDIGAQFAAIERALAPEPADIPALKVLLSRYGFRTWLNELEQEAPRADATDSPPLVTHYETIWDEAHLHVWLERLLHADLVSLDTETTSLRAMDARLVGISFCVEEGVAAYLPLTHRYTGVPEQVSLERALSILKPWLEDPSREKLGQNIKYDSHVFANHGICLRGIAHDTMLQSYVLESRRRHDMDSLARHLLGLTTIPYEAVCGKGAGQIGFWEVDIEQATTYAAQDADITLRLHHAMWPLITADAQHLHIYREIELPASSVLQKIERHGVLIDVARLRTQSAELGEKINVLRQQVFDAAGSAFNLDSPKQLGEILFGRLGLPVSKKTPSGTPSTGEEVLQKLAEDYPLPRLILEYRTMAKLKSTYTDKLPHAINAATRRVHTSFAQAVAVTGRLASSEPNLQNIPIRTVEGRRIRSAFVAPEGYRIVSADYSQIELRIMAHMSGDAGLLLAFSRGEDIHRATAGEIFDISPAEVSAEQRRTAKVINFGLIYGMSAFGLANNLDISRQAAQAYIERYFLRYPAVARYMEDTRQRAREDGFVETVFGRRLWLPEIGSPNGQRRQAAERAAINAPMQGTAADVVKLAMISVQKWLEEKQLASSLILQVHDELVLEVPESELTPVCEALPALMGQVARLKVPLVVDVGVGDNWDEAH